MSEKETKSNSSNVDDGATKKKYAILYGYCGTGYQGSQTNIGAKTIDDDLIDGLHNAGCISDQNYNDERHFIKIGWNRAARTDKGVHAAGNVVSCKLEVVPGKEKEAVERINNCLPEAIRVFKIMRTTKSFCAKNFCDRRQYEYLLPVYTLEPFDAEHPPCKVSEDIRENWKNYKEYESSNDPSKECKAIDVAKKLIAMEDSLLSYTPDEQDHSFGGSLPQSEWPAYLPIALQRLRACMSLFIGTHNFHNYTTGKSAMDSSAYRHLLSIIISDPIRIHNELYLRIRLDGQSFMIHQIRKMIGISIETARGSCTLYKVFCSLSVGNVITPLAPSTGLFLDKTIFSGYNKKVQGEPSKIIDLDDPEIIETRCAFKRKQIYEHIDDNIQHENSFRAWIASNDSFHLDYSVSYPSEEACNDMEKEARMGNRLKRQEKEEKWEQRRKFVKVSKDEKEEREEGCEE